MLRQASQVSDEAGLSLTPHCRSADRLTFAVLRRTSLAYVGVKPG